MAPLHPVGRRCALGPQPFSSCGPGPGPLGRGTGGEATHACALASAGTHRATVCPMRGLFPGVLGPRDVAALLRGAYDTACAPPQPGCGSMRLQRDGACLLACGRMRLRVPDFSCVFGSWFVRVSPNFLDMTTHSSVRTLTFTAMVVVVKHHTHTHTWFVPGYGRGTLEFNNKVTSHLMLQPANSCGGPLYT